MNERDDLAKLIAGELDSEVIERLKNADREAMRALLSKYLKREEVEVILQRIDALIAAQRGG